MNSFFKGGIIALQVRSGCIVIYTNMYMYMYMQLDTCTYTVHVQTLCITSGGSDKVRTQSRVTIFC